jgi:glycosyltransferase involved in cell wall biosynthesis
LAEDRTELKVVNAMVSDRKGGMERAFLNISECVSRLGWEVEDWFPSASPYAFEHAKKQRFYSFRPKGYYDLAAILGARKRLKAIKPDLILAHNSRATSILVRASKGLDIPVVCFAHSNKFKRIKSADYIVCLTKIMAQKFSEKGFPKERLSIFPNVMLELPQKPKREFINKEGGAVLGFLGRLAPEKGLVDLLNAMSILRKKGCPCSLRIAGSGDDQARIESLARQLGIERFVEFDGWVENIGKWFESIDLAVAPSKAESFGIVVLESAAFGCPMISTRVSGPESQIHHDEDGWLVEPGEPQLLAEMIEYAFSERQRWPVIAANAFKRASLYAADHKLSELESMLRIQSLKADMPT